MKRTLFIAVLVVSITAFGQTNSPVVNEFISKYLELESRYRTICNEPNFKQTETVLKEILTLIANVKLSDEEIAEYQLPIDQINANTHYNLACTYSLLNQKKEAITAFEKSVALGYNDYYHILGDTDLDNIRKEKRFVALLKKLSKNTHLSVLKEAGGYEKSDTVGLPHFYYETPENDRLQNVRKYFKLDSIAGNGDEISKMLNIMYWLHNNVAHDGANYALAEFDAIDLYNYHKATGKGINCRLLAISLNEMYLSMGWKSRYVTCLPKDENDLDCHVINSVWVDSLQKWVLVDATFAAYIKDENGNFLSIGEVRERLIDGRPLMLNEDANWNNKNKKTKEEYLLSYMAKNLYWLQVPVNSVFNVESRYRNTENKYVSLLPIGYNTKKSTYETVTHNQEYFWQKP